MDTREDEVDRSRELLQVIKQFGGVTKVSKMLDMTPGGLYDFIKRGDLTARDAALIERLSAGEIRAERLNRFVDWETVRSTARKELVKKIIEGGAIYEQ